MICFVECYFVWVFIIFVVVVVMFWFIFVVWLFGLEEVIGCKWVFFNVFFNGIMFGGFYFFVVSGFMLIFGLMCNVNFVYGLFYLFGGYVGYVISVVMGLWIFVFIIVFILMVIVGVLL